MKRACKLLKACRALNNSSTIMISRILCYLTYIMIIMGIETIVMMVIKNELNVFYYNKSLSYISTVMIVLIMRSINTNFSVDRRIGTKKDLRAMTIHLPISKKDYILAQYIENLYLYAPAYILVMGLIIFNMIMKHPLLYQFEVGIIILTFTLTYIVNAVGKATLTIYYLDPRIREVGYIILVTIWISLFLFTQSNRIQMLVGIVESYREEMWFRCICRLSQTSGCVLCLISLAIGYFCYVRMPERLERRNR